MDKCETCENAAMLEMIFSKQRWNSNAAKQKKYNYIDSNYLTITL